MYLTDSDDVNEFRLKIVEVRMARRRVNETNFKIKRFRNVKLYPFRRIGFVNTVKSEFFRFLDYYVA